MTREQRAKVSAFLRYTVLIIVGIIMVYPLIWMVGATFKTNSEIFTSAWFWPKNPVFDGYDNAFKSYGGKIDLIKSMINTYKIVIPKVVFTVVSATITAYGFARFEFKGKGILFSLMISTLFLPQVVLNAPQYIMYNGWGWTDSYLPLVIPSLFAADTYFVFMLVQFLRGLPRDLDESAYIDGCGPFQCFIQILLPLLKPALFSAGLFQFLWTWNDFFNTNIYINTVSKFPLSLALRVSIDVTSNIQWNQVMSMALVSILPLILLFFAAQKYFVEGIATTGMKG